MWLTAQLVPGAESAESGERSLWYFDINALALAVCAAIAVAATALTHRRRPWDAALVAVAPMLALAGTINWDLWAIALLSLAMLAWARSRLLLAGVLIGLAAATKFYPLFLLGPLLVLCWRTGRMREYAATVVAAVCAWGAVNVPVMLADFDGWLRFYELSRERGAGFGSIWFVLSQQGYAVPEDALNLLAGGLFAACCAAIGLLGLRAPVRPRVAQLMLLVVAAFVLTNKVYSPQYALWLLPLVALAHPRWRDFLIWQAAEVIHFFGTWWLIAGYPPGNPSRALGDDAYGVTVLAHVLGTLWLVVVVVRDILRPDRDPVRLTWEERVEADDEAHDPVSATPVDDAYDEPEPFEEAYDPAGGILNTPPSAR
jgi:uncharacterized membrane protein